MLLPADVSEVVKRAGVDLLVLFGSRARGEERSDSDWDLAYRVAQGTSESFDPDALLADLVGALGSDRIDLVDLSHGSALLRFRIAAEGKPVYQADANAFPEFQLEAVRFWCDLAPVLERRYADVLAGLSGP
jgi:predicted nucleotidyltransferase